MKQLIRKMARSLGYDIVAHHEDGGIQLSDLTAEQREILRKSREFTMTGQERMIALINAINYVVANGIPGDIAECGVWRGGSMMVMALTLLAAGDRSRSLYLYDTFEGMSEPTEHDKSQGGETAEKLLQGEKRGTGIWCYASVEDVRTNLLSTGYPAEKIHLIQGKVEDTIPQTLPTPLALLRLDTDWYESTRHELQHLYPLLRKKGILVIDDYGHWQGARKAVDEYFRERSQPVYLHRVDYTARLLVKDDE
jgi:O-methyltransferase